MPADLYKSSILVDVEGVEVLLKTRAAEKEEQSNSYAEISAGQDGEHFKGVKTDRPRTVQLHIHDPGGLRSSQQSSTKDGIASNSRDINQLLPSTVDLAQSFLQEEPQAEKVSLEAAISGSYNLDEFPETKDEASSYGMGNALALPTFLADFLKGVGDRVQVKIKAVTVDLEASLDIPLGSSAGSTTSDKPDVITIRLSVEGIDLSGAASVHLNSNQGSSKPSIQDPEELSSPIIQEIRKINFRNIQVMLVSDALLFANLSRFDVPSSPATTQTSSVPQPSNKPISNISRLTSSTFNNSPRIMESTTIQDNQPTMLTPSALEASTVTSDSERFADVENENEIAEALTPLYASSFEGSRYQDSVLADSFNSNDGDQKLTYMYTNSFSNSDLSQDGKGTAQQSQHQSSIGMHEKQIRLPTADSDDLNRAEAMDFSFSLSSKRDHIFIQKPYDDLRKGTSVIHGMSDNKCEPPAVYSERSPFFVGAVNENTGLESSPSEDLTQSKIFSHEEAESMYMSAISHASSDGERSSITLDKWKPCSSDSEHLGQAINSADQDQQGPSKSALSYLFKGSGSPQFDEDKLKIR